MLEEVYGNTRDVIESLHLSLDEIKTCMDAGLELGIHSRRHRVLSRLDRESQKGEVDDAVAFFRQITGIEQFSFAYPYGVQGAYDSNSVSAVSQSPYMYSAVTLARRGATQEDLIGRRQIPRLDNRDVFAANNSFRSEFITMFSTD